MITLALKTWENRPENHCFLRQVTNVNTNNKVKTTKSGINSDAPKTKQKWGDSPSHVIFLGITKNGGYADEEGGL